MIAPRLVRLIETHSEELTRGLFDRLERDARLPDLKKIPQGEFYQRVHEVYEHLGEWLLNKTESDIEERYRVIGKRRAAQGVALSQVVLGILTVKEHLWEYLKNEGMVERPIELMQEMELIQLVEQFFDRAVFYTAQGYEIGLKELADSGGSRTAAA